MAVAAVAALLAGCPSTTLAPSIIQFAPVRPDRTEFQIGVRSGPRLATAYTSRARGTWAGDEDPFSPFNWGLAWDAAVTFPFKSGLAVHLGGQLEFAYPLPLPGVGAFVGASYLAQSGRFSIAPSLAVRGATDFGTGRATTAAIGGVPGSAVSADVGITLGARVHDDVRFGLVPFVSLAAPFSSVAVPLTVYAGAVLAVRVARMEFTVGFGRVIALDGTAFTVPLVGVRAGEF